MALSSGLVFMAQKATQINKGFATSCRGAGRCIQRLYSLQTIKRKQRFCHLLPVKPHASAQVWLQSADFSVLLLSGPASCSAFAKEMLLAELLDACAAGTPGLHLPRWHASGIDHPWQTRGKMMAMQHQSLVCAYVCQHAQSAMMASMCYD